MSSRLPALLAELGERLPAERLAAWATALRAAEHPYDVALDQLVEATPAAGLAVELRRLRRTWREEAPELPGAALALALDTVARTELFDAARSDLVVSGPTSPAIPVRLTRGIAIDVIRSAQQTLLLASFAAYGITDLVTELGQAVQRGVLIDVLLDGSTAAARPFTPLRDQIQVWLPAEGSSIGRLHAKVIAADRHTALLGSANLTNRALDENVEVGVMLRDPRLVGRLVDHFRWLSNRSTGLLRPG
ncbi:DISARM system phospholipase D-like protein DrmC [Streptomyces iakyrus]|uniref:DISARM system phospholipase D-like protein DrmC n=1 Tax=Streptomyces iakyrus TaxID=68219 RepID=UPI00052797DB|nr:DISARM system phospholipase D-like protein DrmC [Streptomyces iakyrus]